MLRSFVAALFLAESILESPLPDWLTFDEPFLHVPYVIDRLHQILRPLWKIDFLKAVAIACSEKNPPTNGTDPYTQNQRNQLASLEDTPPAHDFDQALATVLDDLERTGILLFLD
eukprot:GABV01008218.1.p2 GENE.GABV01008218.1~~GABV01008218.1.p2  ORF type:complete len:128 (-),score=40.31 GABV01008218.1:11-355(-)